MAFAMSPFPNPSFDGPLPAGAHAHEPFLVARLRDGDTTAFAELVRHYMNSAMRFATHLLGSRDAAEDIVQSVFIHVWERRSTLDPARSFKSYVFRAVRNSALNDRKAAAVRQRYQTAVQDELASGTTQGSVASPERRVLDTATVQAALQRLSDRRRIALRLRLIDELSHAEIADVLGISATAAQSLVVRAIADLREILRDGA